jgi:hypothetical protein
MGDVVDDRPEAVLIAVSDDLVDDLVEAGLVGEFPGLRHSVLDALLTVGSSAMTVVTLNYAPARIRAFADWLRERSGRTVIELTDTRSGRTFTLRSNRPVAAENIAAFVAAALHDPPAAGPVGRATDGARPRVFVCYAHDSDDHKDLVRRFAEFLVRHGIDANLDSWNLHERRNWQLWATREIRGADYVLVIASPRCRQVGDGENQPHENRGLRSELNLIAELYHSEPDNWPKRIMPVVLPGRSAAEIPSFLQPNTADHYIIDDFTVAGAEDLLRHLTRQPPYQRPVPGDSPVLPLRA